MDMRSPLKLWNTNKRHHIASIGGLARLDRLPEEPAEELIVALAGLLSMFFISNNNWFYNVSRKCRGAGGAIIKRCKCE
jgi:hypothetical protein